MERKINNLIFDLDGTLLDTLDDLWHSVNASLEHFGFPARSREETRAFVGNGVEMLMRRAIPSGVTYRAEYLEYFKKWYEKHGTDNTRPYEGIPQLLLRLKEDGRRIAVVSNKFDPAVRGLCDHYFRDLTDIAVGESDTVRKKPAPDMVLSAMEILGATAADSVYIGDSDVDIQTASNSGLECISVLWGFRTRSFLEDHGAKIFAADCGELYAIISKM